jgi:hypothetical protein
MDTTQMQAAADRLGAKLDALDLDMHERAVLEAICVAGASSVESADSEVQGFAFGTYGPIEGIGDVPTESVSLHVRKAGGKPVEYLRFDFTMVAAP